MIFFVIGFVSFSVVIRCAHGLFYLSLLRDILSVRLCEAWIKNFNLMIVTQGGARPVIRDSLYPGLFYAGPLGRFGYPPAADVRIILVKFRSLFRLE